MGRPSVSQRSTSQNQNQKIPPKLPSSTTRYLQPSNHPRQPSIKETFLRHPLQTGGFYTKTPPSPPQKKSKPENTTRCAKASTMSSIIPPESPSASTSQAQDQPPNPSAELSELSAELSELGFEPAPYIQHSESNCWRCCDCQTVTSNRIYYCNGCGHLVCPNCTEA